MSFERARTSEQINERKRDIINACLSLFKEGGIDGVHFKAIGEMTSIKRSTIYNYYNTKEEILLDALMEEMKLWAARINHMMKQNDTLTREAYCRKAADTFVESEDMMRLFSILFSHLEKYSTVERLAAFKKEMVGVMTPFMMSVGKYFPGSSEAARAEFMYMASSYLVGLYSSSHLTDKQVKAMEMAEYEHQPINYGDTLYKGFLLLSAAL